jgi:hypothetical protein
MIFNDFFNDFCVFYMFFICFLYVFFFFGEVRRRLIYPIQLSEVAVADCTGSGSGGGTSSGTGSGIDSGSGSGSGRARVLAHLRRKIGYLTPNLALAVAERLENHEIDEFCAVFDGVLTVFDGF